MNSLNKTTVVSLTNKSGGAVAKGDVVILSSATANAFTTTTSAAETGDLVGVVVEPNGIADNAAGMVALAGYVGQVNLSASASLGDTFGTNSVAKQAVPHAAIVSGDFGQVLGTGATPAAQLWGFPVQPAAVGAAQPYVYIVNQQTNGVDAEAATTGAWRTRVLTDKLSDSSGIATLASNQITLTAGTYRILASVLGLRVDHFKGRLRNVTGAITLVSGTPGYSGSGAYYGAGFSTIVGEFTVAAAQVLEIQQYVETSWVIGYGTPMADGEPSIYVSAEFWKVS